MITTSAAVALMNLEMFGILAALIYEQHTFDWLVDAMLQLKSLEQQHSQIGSGDRHAALATLREKEAAVQANGMQLFSRRLQLLQEEKTTEVGEDDNTARDYVQLHVTMSSCIKHRSWCDFDGSLMSHDSRSFSMYVTYTGPSRTCRDWMPRFESRLAFTNARCAAQW